MLAGSTADRIGRRRVFRTGPGRVLARLAAVRAGAEPRGCWSPPACCRRSAARCSTRSRCRSSATCSRIRASGPRRSASGAPCSASAWRSVRWSAACWSTRSAGGRCSSSTSRSACVAFVLTTLFVPSRAPPHPRRLDPVGQVLVIVALASLTYAIIEAPQAGWTSAGTLGLFAFSLACFAALVWYELRRREPLLEMRFFRSAPFSGASTIAVCAFAAIGGFLFLNTLYLQGVRGLSPFHAGLYMLPMAGMVLVFAPISGRMVGRRGPRPSLVIAGVARAGRVADAHPADADAPRPATCSSPTCCSGSGPGWSTRRSPTPRCRACRPRRPASPPPSPRPAGRSGLTLGVAVHRRDRRRRHLRRDRPELRRRHPRRLVDLRRPRRPLLVLGVLTTTRVGGGDRARHGRALPRERARRSGTRGDTDPPTPKTAAAVAPSQLALASNLTSGSYAETVDRGDPRPG